MPPARIELAHAVLANGPGRLGGVAGTPTWFYFTDEGDSGKGADRAELQIGAGPLVSGLLDGGNHQAHRSRP